MPNYTLKDLTIHRDGKPVKRCATRAEASGLMLALVLNPDAGKGWEVIAPPPAKSGIDIPTMPTFFSPDHEKKWRETYLRVLEDTGSEHMAYQAALGVLRRLVRGMNVKSAQAMTGLHVTSYRSDGLLLVDGWGAMFGDDEVLDTWGTFFAEDTDFLDRYYPNAPLWYEHGFDDDYGGRPIGMRYAVKRYKFGLRLIHVLHADHPLIERTIQELQSELLAYSSDSIGHYVDRGLQGAKMGVWPLAGCSLVKRPAEPGLGLVTLGLAHQQGA